MNYSTFLSSIFLIAHIAHFATIGSPISRATPNHKNSHPRTEGYVLIPPSHVTTAGSRVPLSQCKTSGKFEPPSSSRRPQETNKCPCYLRFVTPARSLFFSFEDSAAHTSTTAVGKLAARTMGTKMLICGEERGPRLARLAFAHTGLGPIFQKNHYPSSRNLVAICQITPVRTNKHHLFSR